MQGFHAGAVVMEGAHNTLTLLVPSVYSITTYNCIISNKCAWIQVYMFVICLLH